LKGPCLTPTALLFIFSSIASHQIEPCIVVEVVDGSTGAAVDDVVDEEEDGVPVSVVEVDSGAAVVVVVDVVVGAKHMAIPSLSTKV